MKCEPITMSVRRMRELALNPNPQDSSPISRSDWKSSSHGGFGSLRQQLDPSPSFSAGRTVATPTATSYHCRAKIYMTVILNLLCSCVYRCAQVQIQSLLILKHSDLTKWTSGYQVTTQELLQCESSTMLMRSISELQKTQLELVCICNI